MIAIVNVSPESAPNIGENTYEVRINKTVITTFTHIRGHDGLEQCLRDAADAVKEERDLRYDVLFGAIDDVLS